MATLTLVPFSEAHFALLIRWLADRHSVAQWGGPSEPFPLTEHELRHHLDDSLGARPGRRCWMAHHSALGIVGHVQIACDWLNRVGRVGKVVIAPEARGAGLAGDMLTLALDNAFARDDMQRVELNVYPFNTAAIRTYQRLGFVHEGTRRSSAQVGSERWDTMIMGILREEWLARRKGA
ncbi:Acetyltransferase [Carnimonas sp. R-84981]|uniref:GNAT family N-acetyltransferase n=1 Tax=Carnimonas bestiolae TaxID=3402172 RepID=UPI003EDBD4B2